MNLADIVHNFLLGLLVAALLLVGLFLAVMGTYALTLLDWPAPLHAIPGSVLLFALLAYVGGALRRVR